MELNLLHRHRHLLRMVEQQLTPYIRWLLIAFEYMRGIQLYFCLLLNAINSKSLFIGIQLPVPT